MTIYLMYPYKLTRRTKRKGVLPRSVSHCVPFSFFVLVVLVFAALRCLAALLLTKLSFDEVDGVLDSRYLLRLVLVDLDVEFLFERHRQFDDVERVCAKVVAERRIHRHLLLVDAELV